MASILDIKRRLEKHREELEQGRELPEGLKDRSAAEEPVPPVELRPSAFSSADLKYRRDEEEERQPAGDRGYSRRSETRRDLGMDELLRETKNKEQRHIEELRDEIANLDELKEILNQMIKEGEEHVAELEGKLQKYGR